MTAFVFTGRCPGIERAPLERRIRDAGHAILSSVPNGVSRASTVIVASDEALHNMTSKVRAARDRNIPIWSYSQLLAMLDRNGAAPVRVETRIHVDHAIRASGLGPAQPAFTSPAPRETNISRQIVRAFPEEQAQFIGRPIKRSL